MDSTTSTPRACPAPRDRGRSGKLRRRLVAGLVLLIGLLTTGGLYLVFAPRPQIATAQLVRAQADPALIAKGEQLYDSACITCHGTNLQGVPGRAPSLIGVGAAAVYFQVSTGRMPLAREQPEGLRKAPLPEFNSDTAEGRQNLQALSAYAQAHGGGPQLPAQGGTAHRLHPLGPRPAKQPGRLQPRRHRPVSEGMTAFVVGMVALVGITVWLGAKS